MSKVETKQQQEQLSYPIRYIDRHFNLPAITIGPGEFYAIQQNIVIVTVLGSCVSTCLYDLEKKIGGMNHFMLPYHSAEPKGPLSASARYGAYAMEMLINRLLRLGAKRERLEAKIFGAGKIIPRLSDIGARNAEFALEYLSKEKIPVIAKDLGGEEPSKIYFFPQTGKVLLKRLYAFRNQTILMRERDYAGQLDLLTKAKEQSADIFI